MFELKKWDPARELTNIQREMDELFRRVFGTLPTGIFRLGREFKGEWYPAVECYMRDGKFVVHADLPGVDPKDVDVTIAGNRGTCSMRPLTALSRGRSPSPRA
ncbi:MAG: Hsp20/alpha crystallin family protein [Deltaproteobacteria bacterium]|nr:Hsp20/alpha crystallin family protein [Deltaproteobacteria bacterium]